MSTMNYRYLCKQSVGRFKALSLFVLMILLATCLRTLFVGFRGVNSRGRDGHSTNYYVKIFNDCTRTLKSSMHARGTSIFDMIQRKNI